MNTSTRSAFLRAVRCHLCGISAALLVGLVLIAGVAAFNSVWLQFEFLLGAHGAHKF